MQEIWVQSLSWEDPLEKEMAIPSSILAWVNHSGLNKGKDQEDHLHGRVCVCVCVCVCISLHLRLICNWILHSLRSQFSLSVTLALDIDTYNEFLVWKPHFFKNCELDEWYNFNVRRHNLGSESESFLKSTHSESWWEDSNEKDGGKYLIELRILWISFTSLMAQTVKNLPAIQEIQIQSMGSLRVGHDWATSSSRFWVSGF